MHTDELWQVYAPNGEVIPGKGWNAALDNPEDSGADEIVGVAIVFLFRVNEEGVLEVLWQRRSDKVSRHPGMWDISAGGHINLGESLVEACIREAHEEIGAAINAENLFFVTMMPFNKNRFAFVYAFDYSGKEDVFSFDDGEVSEVRWVPYSEMEEFRLRNAKKPLAEDELTFKFLRKWFEMHGYL